MGNDFIFPGEKVDIYEQIFSLAAPGRRTHERRASQLYVRAVWLRPAEHGHSVRRLDSSIFSSLFRNLTVRMIFLVLSYALMFWAIYRALSRNTYKRYQENRKFLLIFDRLKDRNNRYFNCPKCHQTVRVPRGKGKISITCPKCREKFIRKT